MENKTITTTTNATAASGVAATSTAGSTHTASAISSITTNAKEGYKKITLPKFTLKTGKLKVPKVSLWFMLALLAAREFVPGIEEHIPAVYGFLDSFAVPVVNWVYAIAAKLLNWVASLPLIETILEWLASLAM